MLESESINIDKIFAYKRVIEDTIDLILTRSRSEADLQSIATNVKKLMKLKEILDTESGQHNLPCSSNEENAIIIKNLEFSRIKAGEIAAVIKIPSLILKAGII